MTDKSIETQCWIECDRTKGNSVIRMDILLGLLLIFVNFLREFAATQLLTAFIELETLQTLFCQDGKVNLMRTMFHPQGLRPFVVNWEDIAGHLLQRVHREATSTPHASIGKAAQKGLGIADGQSEQSMELFDELTNYLGVSELLQISNRVPQDTLLLTIHLKRHPLELQFFSTIATLGTAYDITLQELRIECLFPADEATEQTWKHYRSSCQTAAIANAETLT